MSTEGAFGKRDESSFSVPLLRSQHPTMVLGLVIEKPSHGYEIGLRFDERFGGFIPARTPNIYRVLERLVQAGLIERISAASPMTAARRGAKAGASYRATARGARAYTAWLAERFHADPQRIEMLGRMALAGVNSVDAALDFIVRYEEECLRAAKALAPSDQSGMLAAGGVTGLVQRLLVDERRRMLDAQFAWISYARAELRALTLSPGTEAS